MNLVDELHAICRTLTGAGVEDALCGDATVTMHGATRSSISIW